MSNSVPAGYEYHVVSHTEHPGLTSRFLKPADFRIADLPAEEPDFAQGAQFMPLAVAVTQYGPMVFSVAARPAFDDGVVAQWLDYICRAEGYAHTPIEATTIGACPAVTCDATQQADDVTMKMRFVLLEDGGRLIQMSAMAPELLWDSAIKSMAPMLASFELQETRGPQVALLPGQPVPTREPPTVAAPAVEPPAATPPTAKLTPDEMAALALAADAASLDPEHSTNANLRNRGVGLVPRVLSVDLAGKCATVAAAALAGFIRLPLGWHVIDDGKRTLIFDAAGKIQINLSQRLHEGTSPKDFARACLDQYLALQPDLPIAVSELDGIFIALVREVDIDGETLDQCFLVRDVGREGLLLVARTAAKSVDSIRAMTLAADIVVTFSAPSR